MDHFHSYVKNQRLSGDNFRYLGSQGCSLMTIPAAKCIATMTRISPISGDIPYLYIYIYIHISYFNWVIPIPWFLSMSLQCSGDIIFLLFRRSSSRHFFEARDVDNNRYGKWF